MYLRSGDEANEIKLIRILKLHKAIWSTEGLQVVRGLSGCFAQLLESVCVISTEFPRFT